MAVTIRGMAALAILVIFSGAIVLAMIAMVSAPGCTATLGDAGSVSVDFRQGFTIGHKSSTTNSQSMARLDFKPLSKFIADWPDAGTNG